MLVARKSSLLLRGATLQYALHVTRHVARHMTSVAVKEAPPTEHHVRPFSEMPTPRGVPLLGNLEDVKMLYGHPDAHQFFMDRFKKYGPVYRIRMYNKNTVILFDVSQARNIVRAEGMLPDYPKINDFFVASREERLTNHEALGFIERSGKGVAEIRRAIGRRSLVPRELLELVPYMNQSAQYTMREMKKSQAETGAICLDEFVPKFFMEVSGYFIFGQSIGTFDPQYKGLMDEFFGFSGDTGKISLTHQWHTIPRAFIRNKKSYTAFAERTKRGRDIVTELTKNAREVCEKQIARGEEPLGLLYPMMQQMTEGENIDMAISDLMTGGAHPGTTVLLGSLWKLAKNPAIQEKVFREVKEVMEKGGSMDKDVLLNLKYLEALYKESVRYTVPGGITARHSLAQETELFGYQIPVGTEVMYHHYVCSRNPIIHNPEEFRPERWLENSEESAYLHAFHRAVPFGVGTRMCPGKRIVAISIPLILAHLVRNFKIRPAMEGDAHLKAMGMNFMDRPIYVKFEERAE